MRAYGCAMMFVIDQFCIDERDAPVPTISELFPKATQIFSDLNTRLVVLPLPIDRAPKPAARFNPIFEAESLRFSMVTQFAASVPIRELGEIVQSLGSDADAIGAALDMLIISF